MLIRNGYSQASASAAVELAGANDYLTGATHAQKRLQREASMLNVLGELARLDSGLRTIERCAAPSREEFRDRYYAANRPVILTGLMSDWPAMTRWTPEYLRRAAGDQIVEVMTGRDADPKYELNGRAHSREMRFGGYIDMVHSGRVTNDYYLVANNGFFRRPGHGHSLATAPSSRSTCSPLRTASSASFGTGPPERSRRCTVTPATSLLLRSRAGSVTV